MPVVVHKHGQHRVEGEAQTQEAAVATSAEAKAAIDKFVDLGLPLPLARQLIKAFPHIRAPTLAQVALLDVLPNRNDVILRTHTGTGKSFALLLGLLAKPRVLFARANAAAAAATQDPHARTHGIASIIVVPSNELAFQYYSWARTLLPQSGADLHPIIQVAVRGHPSISAEEQIRLLRNSPPHLLVATPTRLVEILSSKSNDGAALLGLSTLRTLALDEADALLDLPGRFPSHKLKWRHTVHPAPALIFLNEVMRLRPSCSGGQLLPSAGLERQDGRHFDERSPPEAIRRTAHRSRAELSKMQQAQKQEANANTFYSAFNFALPRPRHGPTGSAPVQLVVTSATANAVLRHFFGARTGWLRTGVKEPAGRPKGQSASRITALPERVTGVWLDLSGLTSASAELAASLDKHKASESKEEEGHSTFPSGAEGSLSDRLKEEARKLDAAETSAYPMTMPEELTHYCIVVDEPSPEQQAELASASASAEIDEGESVPTPVLPPMRNLDPRAFIRPYRKARDLVSERGQPDLATTIRSVGPEAHEVDPALLSALAFAFASDGAARALALIPPRWSLRRTRRVLEGWGVPVRTLDEEASSSKGEGEGEGGEASQMGGSNGPVLYLLQATSARGLDLPVLSHVFIVGVESIGDAVRYTHLAGRASRIGMSGSEATSVPATVSEASVPSPSSADNGGDASEATPEGASATTSPPLRPLAKVITLIRGLPHASLLRRRAALAAWSALSKDERLERGLKRPQHDAIMVSSAERKVWTVWRRTGVSARRKPRLRSLVRGGDGEGTVREVVVPQPGGIGKLDLRLAGGEAVEEYVEDWEDEEEEEYGAGAAASLVEELELDPDEEEGEGWDHAQVQRQDRTRQPRASASRPASTWRSEPVRGADADDVLEFGAGAGASRPRRPPVRGGGAGPRRSFGRPSSGPPRRETRRA